MSFTDIIIKARLPNHNKTIGSSWHKVISGLIEANSRNLFFMTVQRPGKFALPQIPDFDFGVLGSRSQIVPRTMKADLIDSCTMSIVVLDDSVASDIKELDGLVLTARGQTRAVWRESNTINAILVVCEGVEHVLSIEIPQFHCRVVAARTDDASIWRELAWPNPVFVPHFLVG